MVIENTLHCFFNLLFNEPLRSALLKPLRNALQVYKISPEFLAILTLFLKGSRSSLIINFVDFYTKNNF